MKTVVFVDELLLVNFAAAAALLLGAGLLCGRSCTGLRLCVGSAAAAASTLALLAPPCFTLRERLCPCRPTMTPALPCKTLLPGGGWCWCSIRRCAAGCPRRCGKP